MTQRPRLTQMEQHAQDCIRLELRDRERFHTKLVGFLAGLLALAATAICRWLAG